MTVFDTGVPSKGSPATGSSKGRLASRSPPAPTPHDDQADNTARMNREPGIRHGPYLTYPMNKQAEPCPKEKSPSFGHIYQRSVAVALHYTLAIRRISCVL